MELGEKAEARERLENAEVEGGTAYAATGETECGAPVAAKPVNMLPKGRIIRRLSLPVPARQIIGVRGSDGERSVMSGIVGVKGRKFVPEDIEVVPRLLCLLRRGELFRIFSIHDAPASIRS